MRRFVALLTGVTLVLTAGVVGTPAQAVDDWTNVVDLSLGLDSSTPDLAVSADGRNGVMVWLDPPDATVQSRVLANGTWQPGLPVEAGFVSEDPQVAMSAAGDRALAAWRAFIPGEGWVIRTAQYAAGGWGALRSVSVAGQNATAPQVALSADGSRGLMVFSSYVGGNSWQLRSAVWNGSTWTVEPGSIMTTLAGGSSLAMSNDGSRAVVAVRDTVGADHPARAALRSNGTWTTPAQLTQAGVDVARHPDVAISGDGTRSAVGWTANQGSGSTFRPQAAIATNGSWSAATNLTASGVPATDLHVAVGANGATATAAWRQDGANGWQTTAARFAGGVWQPAATVSADTGVQTVNLGGTSNPRVVWSIPGDGAADITLRSSRWNGKAWDQASEIEREVQQLTALQIGVGENGLSGVAGWGAAEESSTVIQASILTVRTVPAAPPAPRTVGEQGTMRVIWQAPVFDGNSPITGYTATASPGGRSCDTTTATTTCVISGLTPGATYTASVTANNALGKSSPSAESIPTLLRPGKVPGLMVRTQKLTPKAPQAKAADKKTSKKNKKADKKTKKKDPKKKPVKKVSRTKITLRWQDAPGATSYRYRLQGKDNRWQNTTATESTSWIVVGKDGPFQAQVFARNASGIGLLTGRVVRIAR